MNITMFRRLYHSTSVLCSIKKQGIKLTKMVNPKSKKQWYQAPTQEIDAMPSVKSLTKTKYEPGKQGARRVAMLNKLFMKYITDIMSTGTVSMNIIGRGIEISKVRITPDFQTLNVFWICKGNAADQETEAVLNKTAGALRHELSTLRLMGEVPYVAFVKDRQEALLVDLDNRLCVADYGEGYTPTELGHLLKSDFTLDMKLSPEMKAKIKQLESELPVVDDPIPEMTHNVYGLDHANMMGRLLAARKKSKDAWNNLDNESNVISYRTTFNKNAQQLDTTKQKRELAEFLHKRQILQKKLAKQDRKSREDLKVAAQEIPETQYEPQYDMVEEEDYYDFDEDYFDDRPKFEEIKSYDKIK
ncbi:putative ribosome-binding factor A, mitochondrial [Epargyreus clarus]|uniref:putative ribosome-binding factor A, mitochondrial n=1 Tax=Epargyreus clarus TaxID=520877 RepID=UPI003C30AE66